jgi:hypothetical protein
MLVSKHYSACGPEGKECICLNYCLPSPASQLNKNETVATTASRQTLLPLWNPGHPYSQPWSPMCTAQMEKTWHLSCLQASIALSWSQTMPVMDESSYSSHFQSNLMWWKKLDHRIWFQANLLAAYSKSGDVCWTSFFGNVHFFSENRFFSEIIWENPNFFRKFRNIFGFSQTFSFGRIFLRISHISENWDFSTPMSSWLRSGACEHGPGIIFWKEHGHRTFTAGFYNCVSSGRPAIIERLQVITHRLTRGLRAARYQTQSPWNRQSTAHDAAPSIWKHFDFFWVWWFSTRSIWRATWKGWLCSAKFAWLQWGRRRRRAQSQSISSGKGTRGGNAPMEQMKSRRMNS